MKTSIMTRFLLVSLLSLVCIACDQASQFEGKWEGRAIPVDPKMATIAAKMPVSRLVITQEYVSINNVVTPIASKKVIFNDGQDFLVINTEYRTNSLEIVDKDTLVMVPDKSINIHFTRTH